MLEPAGHLGVAERLPGDESESELEYLAIQRAQPAQQGGWLRPRPRIVGDRPAWASVSTALKEVGGTWASRSAVHDSDRPTATAISRVVAARPNVWVNAASTP